jgi:hypothetical protein
VLERHLGLCRTWKPSEVGEAVRASAAVRVNSAIGLVGIGPKSAWLVPLWYPISDTDAENTPDFIGAGEGNRTLDTQLGKVISIEFHRIVPHLVGRSISSQNNLLVAILRANWAGDVQGNLSRVGT